VSDYLCLVQINEKLLEIKNKGSYEVAFLFFFLKIPVVWFHYTSMRRDIELFILNYKNAKECNQFEAIIQILPDSVMVVGAPEEGAFDNIKPPELSNGEESVAESVR